MDCARLVIRSSHESEDSARRLPTPGFREVTSMWTRRTRGPSWSWSRLSILSARRPRVSRVRQSRGDDVVIVQEQISVDVSGVVLSSCTFDGLDYLLVRVRAGELCVLMQGDVDSVIPTSARQT